MSEDTKKDYKPVTVSVELETGKRLEVRIADEPVLESGEIRLSALQLLRVYHRRLTEEDKRLLKEAYELALKDHTRIDLAGLLGVNRITLYNNIKALNLG